MTHSKRGGLALVLQGHLRADRLHGRVPRCGRSGTRRARRRLGDAVDAAQRNAIARPAMPIRVETQKPNIHRSSSARTWCSSVRTPWVSERRSVRVAYVPFQVSGHALKVVGVRDRWAQQGVRRAFAARP